MFNKKTGRGTPGGRSGRVSFLNIWIPIRNSVAVHIWLCPALLISSFFPTMLTYDQSPTSFYGSTRAAGMASSAIPVSKAYVPNLKPRNRHLFIVTGPAGSGKSTVARHLADRFNFPYLEGDEVNLIS